MNTTDQINTAIEEYFESARTFSETELAGFVAKSGISMLAIKQALPDLHWHLLRHKWLLSHLRRAMHEVYSTAKRREEFTLAKIFAVSETHVSVGAARLYIRAEWLQLYLALPSAQQIVLTRLKELVAANTPYCAVTKNRLREDTGINCSNVNWLRDPLRKARQQLKSSQTESIIKAATAFLNRVNTYGETKRAYFVSTSGIQPSRIIKIFPHSKWEKLRRDWLVKTLRSSMKKIYKTSKTRQDFTIEKIVKGFNVPPDYFSKLLGEEWRKLVVTLPRTVDISRSKVLKKLDELVKKNLPLNELTVKRLFKEAGVFVDCAPWISVPLRAARVQLATKQRGIPLDEKIKGTNLREVPGAYIDLDKDIWDFNIRKGLILRRELRDDLADICWSLLKEEMVARRLSLATVCDHYRAYKKAGNFLGQEVPNIKVATLEGVQRAWASFLQKNSAQKLKGALVRVFIALYVLSERDSSIHRVEIVKIIAWLSGSVKIPVPRPSKDFLSEHELHEVIIRCLQDIEDGFQYLASKPDLLTINSKRNAAINASPVVNLTAALQILIMTFTGLRRASVMRLEVKNAFNIRPNLNAFIWSHPKIQEEKIVITPALIARLVELYVACTNEVRQSLETNRVFLFSGDRGDWTATPDDTRLTPLLEDFVRRHNLTRNGDPIGLSATILRRTYATHQLNLGRSIWFVRAQLGHKDVKTTAAYTQKDRFEHPQLVAGALNAWGRSVLDLWHKPVLLVKETPALRETIFSDTSKNENLDTHGGSPCSTCEHLYTGAEFMHQWEDENIGREKRIRELAGKPSSAELLVQEMENHEEFMLNYQRVREGE